MLRLHRYQRTDATLQEFLAPHCLPFAVELHRRGVGRIAAMTTATGQFHFGVIGAHADVDEEVWIDAGGACPLSSARTWNIEGEPITALIRFGSLREARRRIGFGRRAPYAADPRAAVDRLLTGQAAVRRTSEAP